ncbi:hypothetical protein D3C80_920280 [compost metagenome]
MARRHAGTAVRHQIIWRTIAQFRGETLLELIGRQEAPVTAQVLGKRSTLGTWDVPGNRIDRFHLTLEARQCAGIEQGQFRPCKALLQLLGTDQQRRIRTAGEGTTGNRRRIQAQRQTGRVPGLQTAIKDEHTVALAQPCQQPPGPRRIGPRTVVIQNHFAIGIDAKGLQALDQLRRLG